MACFWFNQNDTTIEIPTHQETTNITYYKIAITVGPVKWSVLRRYSEFYQLHNQLITDHGLSKDILPSKKVIRNKCPIFIENRRKALEEYLQKILNYLKRTMPRVFALFLNFHVYDIYFVLQDLAYKIFLEADELLLSTKSYSLTPLELNAISECLKRPFPTIDSSTDSRYDFTHIFDLCSQLQSLTVKGSSMNYLDSNIIVNNLQYEFKSFKNLENLFLNEVSLEQITSVGSLRSTLQKLAITKSNMTNISQILQCDVLHKCNINSSQEWTNLTFMDLSNNNLTEIDKTVSLLPNLSALILNGNKISTISDISVLHKLTYLNMSNNSIAQCSQLHTKIGNLLVLNLSQNAITSLKGFKNLYSLTTLDLSCNQITDIEEISYIRSLPILENLLLTGNNVATIIDYRVKVLEQFDERASEICLDNEKPTQSELDKVSVLKALRIVKEGKTPDLNSSFSL